MRLPKVIEPIFFNGEEITRETMHDLYINKKMDFQAVAEFLRVNDILLFFHFKRKRINLRKDDGWVMRKANDYLQKQREEQIDKATEEYERKQEQEHNELWKQAEAIYGKPKPDVTYIHVNGKKYADRDLLDHYNAEVKKIYNRLKHGERKVDKSLWIRNVDLSAMRLHRGLDMFSFSKKSGVPYNEVLYYEKTPDVSIPKEISDVYRSALNISNSELKKIQEVLSGKRKDMHEEEERPIPEAVKQYVFDRDGGKCTKCGRTKYLHYHHKEHYSSGGKHQARNLTLLCVLCHAEEHTGEKGYHLLKGMANKLLGESAWTDSKATETYARK